MGNTRAPLNRTLTLSKDELVRYKAGLSSLKSPATAEEIPDRLVCDDIFRILPHLPDASVDLMFADPPYNLTKVFNNKKFRKTSIDEYAEWLDSWLSKTGRLLKPTASIYICGDWRCSAAIHRVGEKYFIPQNRITWEREKGRGAKSNWKNCSEDIWFFTVSEDFYFDVDAVMLKRQVIAPYTDSNGAPKDWSESENGRFRLTHPSNIWTDVTVPYWSMPENTDHPTQKPEKLLAKIILASSRKGDLVFDPFNGSGTTTVVAKKLERHYLGVEIDETYCCLAQKRLDLASTDPSIQGYVDGVFWERNAKKAIHRLRR
ncbi:MAG TPA: site-specific DNA-methyltransferase [Pyrinomonadaceae bacterium]|nr:site-specific DNA-methyltransferase [Pyrinomonadaceae bacterium]